MDEGGGLQRKGTGAIYRGNWVELVNLPQTEAELAALRRSVIRGAPYGDSSLRRLEFPTPGMPVFGRLASISFPNLNAFFTRFGLRSQQCSLISRLRKCGSGETNESDLIPVPNLGPPGFWGADSRK
jgi:hypothetical protein